MIGIQSITAYFGSNTLTKNNFLSLLFRIGGRPFGAALMSRTVVSLIKFIPVFGTLVGAEINAATGAAITIALGMYI
jgi:uncharacterized protein (DUF697 family)